MHSVVTASCWTDSLRRRRRGPQLRTLESASPLINAWTSCGIGWINRRAHPRRRPLSLLPRAHHFAGCAPARLQPLAPERRASPRFRAPCDPPRSGPAKPSPRLAPPTTAPTRATLPQHLLTPDPHPPFSPPTPKPLRGAIPYPGSPTLQPALPTPAEGPVR